MLAHAEIIVRAPDNDIPLAARAVPERMGELPCVAFQVGEDAIAALTFQCRKWQIGNFRYSRTFLEILW
jgi:hypothetical protein